MKKMIALVLVTVSIVCLFAGCGKPAGSAEVVLPKIDIEDTLENRQKALVETAMAYWYKSQKTYVQYDNADLTALGEPGGQRNAIEEVNSPEYATKDRTVYNVCTSYMWCLIYRTFGQKNHETVTADESQGAIYHSGIDYNDPADGERVVKELKEILQPGDVVSYRRSPDKPSVGHALMWAGDLDGDGDADMINQDGSYYDTVKGVEKREDGSKKNNLGGVDINSDNFTCPSAEYFLFDPAAYDYVGKLGQITVQRHAAMDGYQLTEEAKTRLLFPGLEINYTAENGIYGAVTKGETTAFTLEITNHSDQDHEGILVQMPVPAGSELAQIDGEDAKGKLIKLSIDIPAGQTQTHTFALKAVGEVGNVITTAGGYVHAIPLPALNVVIRSRAVDAEALKTAAADNTSLQGTDFINAVYADMGIDADLPEPEELRELTFRESRFLGNKFFTHIPMEEIEEANRRYVKMLIPDFFGGQSLRADEPTLRCRELLARDLQAGDLLIWQEDTVGEMQIAIHDGQQLVWLNGGKRTPLTQQELDRFLIYRFFVAIRPTQGV